MAEIKIGLTIQELLLNDVQPEAPQMSHIPTLAGSFKPDIAPDMIRKMVQRRRSCAAPTHGRGQKRPEDYGQAVGLDQLVHGGAEIAPVA